MHKLHISPAVVFAVFLFVFGIFLQPVPCSAVSGFDIITVQESQQQEETEDEIYLEDDEEYADNQTSMILAQIFGEEETEEAPEEEIEEEPEYSDTEEEETPAEDEEQEELEPQQE